MVRRDRGTVYADTGRAERGVPAERHGLLRAAPRVMGGLPGAEDANPDSVMADAPAFSAGTPKAFLRSLKPLAASTDALPTLDEMFSAALRGVESAVEAASGRSATATAPGAVMRVRKAVYGASSGYRAAADGVTLDEPTRGATS